MNRYLNRLIVALAGLTILTIGTVAPVYAASTGTAIMSIGVRPMHKVPPKKVTDLVAATADYSVNRPDEGEVNLIWTAPEPNTNKVANYTDPYIKGYMIRWSTQSVQGFVGNTTSWWNMTTNAGDGLDRDGSVDGLFSYRPGEQMSHFIDSVEGLFPGTNYYFAVKTIDLFGNESYVDELAYQVAANQAQAIASIDNIAPNVVTNLAAVSVASQEAKLTWTAPGDDGTIDDNVMGSYYELRWATYTYLGMGTTNWWNSVDISTHTKFNVLAFGATEQHILSGLQKDTDYWFAVRTVDDRGNRSLISTSTVVHVLGDIIPPEAITDLVAVGMYENGLVEPQIKLSWTAPHEDGAVGGIVVSYEVRYATYAHLDQRLAWWNTATPITPLYTPAPLTPGTTQEMVISGWAENEYFDVGTTYWFAIRSVDLQDIWSGVDMSTPQANAMPQVDVTPPNKVMDLVAEKNPVLSPKNGEIELTWSMAGDDGGAAKKYDGSNNNNRNGMIDIRYSSTSVIVSSGAVAGQVAFDNATQWPWGPVPPWLPALGQPVIKVLTGLASDTLYYFAVKTADESDASKNTPDNRNWSEMSIVAVQTTADFTPPMPPTGLTAIVDIANLEIDLSWTAPTQDENGKAIIFGDDLALFRVYRATASFFSMPQANWAGSGFIEVITELIASTTIYSDNSPISGTSNYYIITAVDNDVLNANESGASNEAWAMLDDDYPPVPVTDMVAVPGINEGEILLSWTSPYDEGATGRAEKYYVRMSTFSIADLAGAPTLWWSISAAIDVNDVTPAKSSATVEYLTVTGLIPNVTYWFAVRSEDIATNLSNMDTSTPQAGCKARGVDPVRIVDLEATPALETEYAPAENKVKLTWTAPSDDSTYSGKIVAGYIVKWSLFTTGQGLTIEQWWNDASTVTTGVPVPLSPGSPEKMVVQSLVAGETYYFAIRSVDEYGNMSPVDKFTYDAYYSYPRPNDDVQANSTAQIDVSPPARIWYPDELTAVPDSGEATTMVLKFIAPGDDYEAGNNDDNKYRIGYSTLNPDSLYGGNLDIWWNLVAEKIDEAVNVGVGKDESLRVEGLVAETEYFFVVRTADEENPKKPVHPVENSRRNWSELSNVAHARTSVYQPLKVTGIRGYFSDKNTFVITWSKVGKNDNLQEIEDVSYDIYRTNDLKMTADSWQMVANVTGETYTDITAEFDKYTYYYRLKSVDNLGNKTGEYSSIYDTSLNSIFLAGDDDFVRLVVPQEISSVLYRAENEYGYDIKMSISPDPVLKDKLEAQVAYDFLAQTHEGADVKQFEFSRSKAQIILSYTPTGASAFVVREAKAVSVFSIYFYNGKEGIKVGGDVNEPVNEISIPTSRLGIFLVLEEEQETQVGIRKVYPKTFTPNGDGKNDAVTFTFSNPDGEAIVARIYDIKGAEVAVLSEGYFSGTSMQWDGRDRSGNVVRSGIYIYQIEIGDELVNGTVVVAR